ncbi:MAG: DUF898 family protein [Pseudomonadota bacterium]
MIPERTLEGKFEGTRGALFLLALKTTLLTFFTLGVYRFWAKTRIRRYIWNATQPNGEPFEYTGTGLEKFLGFLIAIVVLAVYLGVFNLGLTFFGLSLLDLFTDQPNEQLILLQAGLTFGIFVFLLPFIYFAQYRGRRYMMSRTRWRGIRFGMDKGSLGYVVRAVLYSILSLLTLTALAPLMVFKLEKYKTDRTWYGTGQFQQGGRWTSLYRAYWPIPFGVLLFVVGGFVMTSSEGLGILVMVLAYIWLMIAIVHFRLQSFAIMARHKSLADDVTFTAEPQTPAVVGTYLLGTLMVILISIAAFIPVVLVGILISVMMGSVGPAQLTGGQFPPTVIASGVIAAIFYVIALAVVAAAAMVYVTQPIYAHIVTSCALKHSGGLKEIRQRPGDEQADADGFADALDVGGAF